MIRIIALILFVSFVGCAPVSSLRVLHNLPPHHNPGKVEIIHTMPKRNYFVVAEFEMHGASASQIKSKAATIGADAVYVTSYSTFFAQGSDATANANSSDYSQIKHGREMLCTAIKYK